MSKIKFDGVQSVADMLNTMSPEERENLLLNLSKQDPELVHRIRDKMFAFEDLVHFSRRSWARLLREIPHDQLVLALRNANDDLKKIVLESLSQGAALRLEEDIADQPPQRLAVVRAAQKLIVNLAQSLLKQGVISLDTEETDSK